MKFLKKSFEAGDAEKLAWLRLIRTENIGPISFHQLLQRFGSATQAIQALPDLASRGGRKKPLILPPVSVVEQEYTALRKIGGDFIAAFEDGYPLALAAINDPPPVIAILGRRELLKRNAVGIVGARNASLNGKKFAEKLSRDLGQSDIVVASGLARGIDTAAHVGSLPTGTIAVVAGGIDVVYPPENQKLYEQIAKEGVIIAESAFGMEPFAQSFPRRNRIVSGLSAGVVVVEATLKSGSLITARMAAEQGRDVYAVPGHPMDPRAEGPNHLIREGATLVRGADDILEHVRMFTGGRSLEDSAKNKFVYDAPVPANDDPAILEEARGIIVNILSSVPVMVDDIIRETGLPIPVLQTVLLELELAGNIHRHPGNRISLIS